MKDRVHIGGATMFALALTLSAPVAAQGVQTVQSIPDPNSPVERLGRYIRVLAGSPRDLESLLGAGQAALDVGDSNAALGFFARAEEVSPTNGRVKAGLGSSLVMIERPDDALRLFAEAVTLGVPESSVARDRGLAYDLRGDSKRAQRDYALAMLRSRDDELVRRYALSLGISGDRAAAMAMLDPLLRKQDQGAWRARAFIMAMTGDVPGANGVARQLMVPAMADAMSPLLSRLGGLNAAERAHAVNFGTVPSDGTQLAVQTGDPYLSASPRPGGTTIVSAQGLSSIPVASTGDGGLIPTGEPLGPRVYAERPVRVAQADSTEPRRRPGFTGSAPAAPVATTAPTEKPVPGFTEIPARRVGTRLGQRIGDVPTIRTPIPSADAARGGSAVPIPSAIPVPTSKPIQMTMAAPVSAPVQGPLAAPTLSPPPEPATAPVFEVPAPQSSKSAAQAVPLAPTPIMTAAPPQSTPSQVAPVPTSSATARPQARLAGLLDGIEREAETAVALPDAAELRRARAAAKKKMAELAAKTAAEEEAKREKTEAAAAAKRNPARVWVQVATGRNDSGLGITLRRLRSDNEAALKGLTGWSAPYKATNRILVGPMKSAAAARELVGKLAKNGVSAMAWSSEAGEEVEKIATK